MTQLVFLDVEATGVDQPDRLLQVAYKVEDEVVNELFKPPVPIKIAAMAVHHVTEAMVADKPAFKDSVHATNLRTLLEKDDAVMVAHNAKYDAGMLAKEDVKASRIICTLKIARYIDDGSFDNHQMQYLRYYYSVDVDATAHDALGDIIVLEQVFYKLREALVNKDFPTIKPVGDEVLDRMVEISKLPSLLRVCKFKKYQGVPWADIAKNDIGYIQWFSGQPDLDEDLKYTLNYYLTK